MKKNLRQKFFTTTHAFTILPPSLQKITPVIYCALHYKYNSHSGLSIYRTEFSFLFLGPNNDITNVLLLIFTMVPGLQM